MLNRIKAMIITGVLLFAVTCLVILDLFVASLDSIEHKKQKDYEKV